MPRANSENVHKRVAPVAPIATREVHTGDTDVQELPPIRMPDLGESIGDELRENVQESLGAHANKDYMTELKFNEEPVSIRIEPSQDENAPLTVDCSVNGIGAEILRDGKWQQFGFLPMGVVVTTKRKYVEVLARSRTMKCTTADHSNLQNVDKNDVKRRNVRTNSFSVIEDKNPRGAAWLTQILNENF